MKFMHEGVEYEIAFERTYRKIKIPQHLRTLDGPEEMDTTFPDTTVNLWRREPGKLAEIFRTATTKAHFRDPFSKETGRLIVLRAITKTLDEALRPLLWKAYLERGK
jgi:hypothetical protein